MVISDKAGASVSVLTPREQDNGTMLDYRQFSTAGKQIFQKDVVLNGFSEGVMDGNHGRLYLMLNESLAGYEGKLRSGTWLTVHPVDPSNPEAVLQEDHYRSIQKSRKQIGTVIGVDRSAHQQ